MIIAFTGYAGTGKTTAANYLVEQHSFIRHNFKDALVAEMKENLDLVLTLLGTLYGMTIDELFANKPPIMRALMQSYGTEVRRKDDPDYWTNQWSATLPEGMVVVDDVRFRNEAEAVKSMGGIIVRLTRPDIRNGGDQQSETEQRDIADDYIFETEVGKPEQIYAALDFIV